ELGDVDQQRVEELRVLVGMHLEVVEVVAVALALDGVHPPPEAALQAGALVAGEVEAARAPEELEQGLEGWVLLFAHSAPPAASRRNGSVPCGAVASAPRISRARRRASAEPSSRRPLMPGMSGRRRAARRSSSARSSSTSTADHSAASTLSAWASTSASSE